MTKYYAGIGSRQITEDERLTIHKIAKTLADKGCVVYSGNAEGSDIAFQEGSEGRCVLLIPWKGFNKKQYDITKSIDCCVAGSTEVGQDSIAKYHPAPQNLSHGGRMMMARNYHQIHGFDNYPQVSFVICCAIRDNAGRIVGGTGQACRIAEDNNIPVFNIRDSDWKEKFKEFVREEK